jgi:enoyl-CoA hydratase
MAKKLEDLLVEREGGLVIVTLNRPAVLNALRSQTLAEFGRVLDEFAKRRRDRALIVTGAGTAFCAGGDVKAMAKMTSGEAAKFAGEAHRVLRRMEGIPKPIIAAVNGAALGAGSDLAISCDIVIASEKASFGDPSARMGIITPFGGTSRLPSVVGPLRAKYLFMTAEAIPAEEARQMGMVNKVVEADRLLDEAKSVAAKVLSLAPIATGYNKLLVNYTSSLVEGKVGKKEIELYARCFDTEDRTEGMKAFIEKRKPAFVGR